MDNIFLLKFVLIILLIVGFLFCLAYIAYKRQDIKFYGLAQGWKVTDYKYIGTFESGAEYEECCKILEKNEITFRDGKSAGAGIAFWVLNEHYDRALSLIPQVNKIRKDEPNERLISVNRLIVLSTLAVVLIFIGSLIVYFTCVKRTV